MSGDRIGYNVTEAAALVGLSRDVLLRAIRAGTLPAKRSGKDENGDATGKYLVKRPDLEAWFDGLADA